MPDQDVIDAMRQENPGVDLEREHLKFSDHWAAASGMNTVPSNASATPTDSPQKPSAAHYEEPQHDHTPLHPLHDCPARRDAVSPPEKE
ncbi:hypothetical protein GCM10027580_19140 [Corynebacterium faecale]